MFSNPTQITTQIQHPLGILKLRQEGHAVYDFLLFLAELIIYFCCYWRKHLKAAPFSESVLLVLQAIRGNAPEYTEMSFARMR